MNTDALPFVGGSGEYYGFPGALVKLVGFLRRDSPLSSSRCAPLSSRSSKASATESPADVRAALASFTAKAAEKLRREGLLAGKLTVWLETDRFRPVAQYANSLTLRIAPLSQCTMELSHLALRGLDRIFRMGYEYRKAGVVLSELETEAQAPRRLWMDEDYERTRRLMHTMDALNARWGRDTLRLGLHPSTNLWKTKVGFSAPGYTTRWGDVLIAG